MSYLVLKNFRDIDDNMHHYHEGDNYPREGYEPSEERIKELSSKENRVKRKLIVKVDEPQENKLSVDDSGENEKFPKHTGGGYYELSNGEKIRGKEEAIAAENALIEEVKEDDE
ncbi:hypothetical protein SAMN05421676_102357 [Salinibacillus kushneri]|uniref:Uncharacterized protein n=1 Tax=Salinibacillus kushneri TaxID=237682 RepID=A0A1I0B6U6_9BACI|nr:hypothetical protein [Salinibacillus kushneri]SET02123.1 hypothetical protein SAMN05421676_102357 [Salinibacillus kushneri]